MMQRSIREFVTENFGRHYYPVYHGQSDIVAPLALIVKRKRKWWKRPFGKAEMIVLASLENYIESNSKKHFHKVFHAKIKKENKSLTKTEVTEVFRCVAIFSFNHFILFFTVGFQSSLHCTLSFGLSRNASTNWKRTLRYGTAKCTSKTIPFTIAVILRCPFRGLTAERWQWKWVTPRVTWN